MGPIVRPSLLLPKVDGFNDLIRRLDVPSATVTTLAGKQDSSAYADGIGTNAMFDTPWGLAVSGNGAFLLVVSPPTWSVGPPCLFSNLSHIPLSSAVSVQADRFVRDRSSKGIGGLRLKQP